jgi:glycosyltransferase involved in cell wall biosynthesis
MVVDSCPGPAPAHPEISVVVPAFDEAGSLPELLARVRTALETLARPWELVVVDDGSTDGTASVLRSLAATEPRLRVFAARRRLGQTAALKAGLARARGAVIVTLDADLQNPPEEIPRLVRALDEGADVVTGWRRHRHDRWLSRRLPSALANAWIRHATGIPIHDHGCALKAYRREVINRLHLYGDHHRLVTAVCALHGARVREIEVAHEPRRTGRSKYGTGRVLRVLADVIAMQMLLRHRRRPSLWFFRLAAPLCVGMIVAALASVAPLIEEHSPMSVVWIGASLILGFGAASMVAAGFFAELLLRLEPSHLQLGVEPLHGEEARA